MSKVVVDDVEDLGDDLGHLECLVQPGGGELGIDEVQRQGHGLIGLQLDAQSTVGDLHSGLPRRQFLGVELGNFPAEREFHGDTFADALGSEMQVVGQGQDEALADPEPELFLRQFGYFAGRADIRQGDVARETGRAGRCLRRRWR